MRTVSRKAEPLKWWLMLGGVIALQAAGTICFVFAIQDLLGIW